MKSFRSETEESLPQSRFTVLLKEISPLRYEVTLLKKSFAPKEPANFITMKPFYVYIVTNPKKTVLYTGMTNDLEYRIIEHYRNRGKRKTFAGRYYCYQLIYYEAHDTAIGAIEREKEIKDWSREKKEELINQENPTWTFLNDQITDWPPHPDVSER